MAHGRPDPQRYVFVYVPGVEVKDRWRDLAKKAKTPLTKFLFNHIERSLRQEGKGGAPTPQDVLLRRVKELEKESEELQRKLRVNEAYIRSLEQDLQRARARTFAPGFRGKRKYDTELTRLFREKGSLESRDILRLLRIDPGDTEAVEGVHSQLRQLHAWGLIHPRPGGWEWPE